MPKAEGLTREVIKARYNVSGKEAAKLAAKAMDAYSKGTYAEVIVPGRSMEKLVGHYHKNPLGARGGFVEITAEADETSIIEKGALVLGKSGIRESLVCSGNEIVDSFIRGSTTSPNAVVKNSTIINCDFVGEHITVENAVLGGMDEERIMIYESVRRPARQSPTQEHEEKG